jgi:tetratricopeptide (TPR) repeat protein
VADDEVTPERELERADAAMAVFDVDGLVAHLSAAIRGFTARDDRRRAAMACVRLGDAYANALGNLTASRAWFARAERLLEDEAPCLEQGWVAVAAMGCDVEDPAVLLRRAELALDRARRFGDLNLETKALADAGLAHVQAGRVGDGMALLDEAMALACGAADDLDAAGKSVCSLFTACYYSADFARAATWAAALRQRGLIGVAPGAPIFLSNHCDSVQATLLVELGRWGEAEALLIRAISDFESTVPIPSWHAAIALADLRVRQRRFVEAEQLLLGKDGHVDALLPTARLHLARGEVGLARATARRGLRAIGVDRLRAAGLLAVLVDAELALGQTEAAAECCVDLDARLSGVDMPVLRARSTAVRARVLAATGDVPGAIAAIEDRVDALAAAGLPWLHVTLLFDLARLRERAGERAEAIVEAKAAAAMLAGLDVVLPEEHGALLQRLGADTAGGLRPGSPTATLSRRDRGWAAACGDARVVLPDTKGVRYLAELIASPGVERHVLDLVDRVEGVDTGEDGAGRVDRRRLGDAGELLDSRARAVYRRRVEALRAEIDDAVAAGDERRVETTQGELDQVVAELARAFGLGGRSRRASSVVERARLNVTRAIRAATARFAAALPEAGAVLDRRVRTGIYCAYEPAADDPVRWIVQRPLNGTGRD